MVDESGTTRNLPWLRLYTEFATDPAIQTLAFEDQRHYIMLLCLKGSGVLDKDYPTPERRDVILCRALGLARETLDEALRRLSEAGLIDLDGHPTGWERRQAKSDGAASAAERQRRLRDRRQAQGLRRRDGLPLVSRGVTGCHSVDVDVDVEESKEKAAPGELAACGYVHNSVDNSAAAPPALSQATTAQNHPPQGTSGKGPSLTYSEAIARGGAIPGRLSPPLLAATVRAVRAVCRKDPTTPADAVEAAVRQMMSGIDRSIPVDPWPYLRKAIPEKVARLVDDRIEAEADARRRELARERGDPRGR